MAAPRRIALVVHPTRPVDGALETLAAWTGRSGVELVQLSVEGTERRVRAIAPVERGDLVVALGGDGTALSALRAAATVDAPVLAVACGSVGALSAVTAGRLREGLEQLVSGDWTVHSVPALAIEAGDESTFALNDLVVVRRGAGQIVADIAVNGEPYVSVGGDGVIVATPLGSSGYTMAAGGPLLARQTAGFVCTPLAMHGGNAPPLVVPADTVLSIDVQPSHAGFDVEVDGHRQAFDGRSLRLSLQPGKARLVSFSDSDQGLQRLRERGLIRDSPRALARGRREAGAP